MTTESTATDAEDTGTPIPRTGASLARHRSVQEVETPPEFIDTVVRRFGPIVWDLAADACNAKAKNYLGPGGMHEDSLQVDWTTLGPDGNLWLNPPFSKIEPWVKKCADTGPKLARGNRILLLVPAAVGANWFARHVWGHARVFALNGRVKFVGHTQAYPKDLILAAYSGGLDGMEVWSWRKS